MKPSSYLIPLKLSIVLGAFLFASCQKELRNRSVAEQTLQDLSSQGLQGHLHQTKTFSAEVAQKWQALQLRILKLPGSANPFGLNGVRYFAYCGIALYESVVPGMPSYQSLHGQLTEMPAMPETEPGKAYHWPTSANAALAYMNKHFYTVTNAAAYQTAMDSLENALNEQYKAELNNDATFERSKEFGLAVAQRIFEWSKTDGATAVYPAYSMAALPRWQPTAPNPTSISGPYWGRNRLFVQGSTEGTASSLPPAYSEVPGSPYYEMVKEVYDVWTTLTDEQKATAKYYYDRPGFPSGTHYIVIFNQIMNEENPTLDFYAEAQVKTGVAMAESMINCWKIKYDVLLDRPIRYIRNVLGYTGWNPLFDTPGHPDFPSGHSQNGGAFATMFTHLFGDNYAFVLRTYDYLGYPSRPYQSFNEMVEDIGKSRVYAGIHYTYSCDEGRAQGNKIAANILRILKFKKD